MLLIAQPFGAEFCNPLHLACASRLGPRAACLTIFLHEGLEPIGGPTHGHAAAVADKRDVQSLLCPDTDYCNPLQRARRIGPTRRS